MKRKNTKKKISFANIMYIIIGVVTGFSIGILSNRIKMIGGFVSPPFWILVLIITTTYFLSVTFHEFGHAIAFKMNKIKMRAIIFMNFMLIKENGKWKFKIIRNSSLGGIAIPEISNIKDEKEFVLKQKGFSTALIAGPVSSILTWFIFTTIGLIILKITSNSYIKSGIIISLTSLCVITFIILATSLIKNDMVVGDFPAYKIAKTDRYFTAMQLYQYGYFSSNPEKAREENIFLRKLIIEELNKKYKNQHTDWYTLGMIDMIMVEYLAGFLEELPEVVDDYINLILNRPDILKDLRVNQSKEIMYFHLIIFLYKNEETKEKAIELYEDIKNTIKPNTPKRKYLFKQIEHILKIADNKEFLMNEKNIVTSDINFIFKHFPGFFMDEIKLNN